MGVIRFSFLNCADAGTLSGGSWQATLPLSNAQGRPLSKVARSTDALAASTRMDLDLGDATKLVHQIALMRHNITTLGTYRVTAGTAPAGSDIYDSGTLDVWPAVFLPGDLEWEDDNWWTGQISAADAALYPITLFHDVGANVKARYWRIQITDTANPAGFVQFGRLWMGPVFSPQRGYQFGAGLTWEPRSESEESLGGVLYFDERPPARIFTFSLGALSHAEAWGSILDAQRLLRNDKELIVIPDPNDAQRGHKRNIYGRLRRSDAIQQIAAGAQSVGFEVEELL